MAHSKTSIRPKQKQSFDWRIWNNRRMLFFTRLAPPVRKNHTAMPSTALSVQLPIGVNCQLLKPFYQPRLAQIHASKI